MVNGWWDMFDPQDYKWIFTPNAAWKASVFSFLPMPSVAEELGLE